MKKIFYSLILASLLFGCSGTSNKEKEPDVKITTDTDFKIEPDFEWTETNTTITGRTNLPSGTKLGVSALKNGKTFAQNFEVFVNSGEFKAEFGVKVENIELIEISCYSNSMWQNDEILSQLKFIKSPLWSDDELKVEINISELFGRKVKEIIGVTDVYKVTGKYDGKIKDVSTKKMKRYSANIILSDKLSEDELDKEIRFFLFDVWQKHKDANAINIKCFTENGDMAFKTGYFAPYGDWSRANERVSIDKFKVKI